MGRITLTYFKGYTMKKLNLTTLLFAAALFAGLGATTLSAEMKCGGGMKCGGSMKCGSSKTKPAEKDGNDTNSTVKCDANKNEKKCGSSK